MRIFRRHINEKKSAATDKAAGWIANSILNIQRRFAYALGKLSVSWKSKQKWIFLYMVCIVFGGLSIISIIQSFNKSKNVLSRPFAIKVPRNILKEHPVR